MLLNLIIAALFLHNTSADYSCLCSYHVERQVYGAPNTSSRTVGYMYEFDCKPILENNIPILARNWTTIAFEHERGYVLMDAQVTRQICPGNPAPSDIVTSPSTLLATTPITSKSTSPKTTIKTSTTDKATFHITKMITQTSVISKAHSTTTPTPRPTTKRITQEIKPSTQSPVSTFPSSKVTISAWPSTFKTPSTISTMATTESSLIPSTTTPIKSSNKSTYSLNPTKTTQVAKIPTTTQFVPTKMTSQFKQTTTDWTIVPWSTRKTSSHPAVYHFTTYHHKTTSHGLTSVNVGNINWCPRAIRDLQQHGTRNLRQHGQWCYELRREPNYNWMEASQDCMANANGFVVQIMSAQDQAFIMNFLREENVHVPIWIGLNDKGPGQEEHFYWDSGAPVKYTNWDPNRKDNENLHGQEDCVILKPNGLWDDTMCKGYLFSDHHHPWICQYQRKCWTLRRRNSVADISCNLFDIYLQNLSRTIHNNLIFNSTLPTF